MKVIKGILVIAAVLIVGVACVGIMASPAARPTLPAPAQTLAAPTPRAPDPSGVGDGVYAVGADIPSGRYKTSGPSADAAFPNCYWSRMKSDSGDFKDIIANDNLQGPGSLTLKAGEFVKFDGGCVWSKS